MYFKNLANISSALKLDPAQSSHIATVLRLKEGDIIELFDGEGLSSTSKAVELISSSSSANPWSLQLHTPDVTVVSGHTYEISFSMKTTRSCSSAASSKAMDASN